MEKQKLKAGLEIHQQLDTRKLFCRCPSILRNDAPLFKVERKLNPVVGETGKIDTAAAFEKSKNLKFIYEVYDTNCLVELDEEPPHEINKEALFIALQISELLNCKPFPVSQVMRKTVIDGSNTSGFQRTVLIAHDGFIETNQGKVGIETLALEEDAARPSQQSEIDEPGFETSKVYKLDRLGIPLIEITTKPELYSAEQIKEAALKIGEILRACKVKRGIGTIRQDLNISIEGGNRVEIKGFQDPRIMILTVEKEVQRQTKLTEINIKLKKLKINPEVIDLTEIFKQTESKIIQNTLAKKGRVLGTRLQGFAGLLGLEFYEGRRFGSELADYAKMHGVGGMIHSDESMEKYHFSSQELAQIKEKLKIKEGDAFVIIADEEPRAKKAIESAISRAKMQTELAVPKEVRKSNPEGSTSFLRPMPGSARMYPETDVPLLKISRELINQVKNNLPKLRGELKRYLQEFGLNDELIKLILEEGKVEDFKTIIQNIDNPNLVAKALVVFPREIAIKENISEEIIQDKLNANIIEAVLEQVGKTISENDVKLVLQKIALGDSLENAVKKEKIDLESEVKKLIKEKPGLSMNGYMGLIMAKFKGKVSGKDISDELNKQLKK